MNMPRLKNFIKAGLIVTGAGIGCASSYSCYSDAAMQDQWKENASLYHAYKKQPADSAQQRWYRDALLSNTQPQDITDTQALAIVIYTLVGGACGYALAKTMTP